MARKITFMRLVRQFAIFLLASLALVYGIDYAAAKFGIPNSRQVFDQVRVDQLYTAPNKYGEIEWSRGDPIMERCVYALFPHFGNNPCWYVQKHTMRTNAL